MYRYFKILVVPILNYFSYLGTVYYFPLPYQKVHADFTSAYRAKAGEIGRQMLKGVWLDSKSARLKKRLCKVDGKFKRFHRTCLFLKSYTIHCKMDQKLAKPEIIPETNSFERVNILR